MIRNLVATTLTLAVLGVPTASHSRKAFRRGRAHAQNVLVIAHRGAHKTVPENTIASLEKAIELGVDYVELDVRRTKDGVLILMHDASINRMTNGKGKIEDLTYDEIHKFDIRGRSPVAGRAKDPDLRRDPRARQGSDEDSTSITRKPRRRKFSRSSKSTAC